MEDVAHQKSEIDFKLQKEMQNMAILKDTVDKSGQLTKGMVSILSSFELRLARLEETILPVYNETGNLQRRQENIESTLTALDHVISFYSVSRDVEDTIKLGPGPVTSGGAGLDTFLNALNKLQAAQEFFEKSNPQSVELENVTSLFSTGGDALNKDFKDLLFRHSKPIPPVQLLDLVGAEDDDPPSLSQFPSTVGSEMVRMAEWLVVHGWDEFMTVYARVRATVVLKSLQQLKEHQRTCSGGSITGVSASSPMVRPKFQARHETPNRRASKKLHLVFEKKATKMLQFASQTLEQSTGLTLGPRRTALHLESREDIVEEQEVENYVVCVMAMLRLIQAEATLMIGVIPLQHQGRVLETITRDAFELLVQDGENIASRAKRCVTRHDFGAVLVVFPILKHLLALRPEFDLALKECDINIRSKYTSILNTLHSTGSRALEELIDHVKSDQGTQLPRDGTVHELTSNVLMFLEQLLDYTDTLGGVLDSDSVYSNAAALMRGKVDKKKALLGIYIKKVLVQLNLTLVSKSDLYGDPCLRSIFRLNNNHHILKALQRSGLLELVKLSESDCEQSYHAMIEEQKKVYIQSSWSRVLNYIYGADDVPVAVLQAGRLRDKDRQLVKDKFSGFNKEMEELARVQRGYSIPDVELRESLKRDNKEYVLPKYNLFYEKYASIPFTKNSDKYVKFTPEKVAALIDTFFDVAA